MQLTLAGGKTRIRLGQKLGAGGEGSIYLIEGQHDRVAKIYKVPPEHPKIEKLCALVRVATPAILRVAAWPVDLLEDAKGRVCGFTMLRVASRKDIHELYSPKSRFEAFPEADFRFLIHVATNIARAFAVIHSHGHVVGDVNHGSVLVGANGTVTFVDCDSFQVKNGTQLFTCDVGVPLFTPPELHGRQFRGLLRTANHDAFGLAIMLFHLLFMGRHPFAGRFMGRGEMTIERAIAEYRFVYGPNAAQHMMERPPGTIPLEAMGHAVASLFIAALDHSTGRSQRPDAAEWVSGLDALRSELQTCTRASWHHYPTEAGLCPWCKVEAMSGVRLFGQRIVPIDLVGAVDVGTLWRAIVAVPEPSEDPLLPSERPWNAPQNVELPSRFVRDLRKTLSILLACGGLAACVGGAEVGGILTTIIAYVAAFLMWPRVSNERRAAADRDHTNAKAKWESALKRWETEASRDAFRNKLKELEKARRELADLANERRRRLARLENEREVRQRVRYLDRFRIDRSKIKGIGAGRTAMLAAYGIETAADIDSAKIYQMSGFGDTLTAELVTWRRMHERNFRFNPNEPVDPRDLAAIDRELQVRRQTLTAALKQGPRSLGRLAQEIVSARVRLMPLLEAAWTGLRVAEARRAAL